MTWRQCEAWQTGQFGWITGGSAWTARRTKSCLSILQPWLLAAGKRLWKKKQSESRSQPRRSWTFRKKLWQKFRNSLPTYRTSIIDGETAKRVFKESEFTARTAIRRTAWRNATASAYEFQSRYSKTPRNPT